MEDIREEPIVSSFSNARASERQCDSFSNDCATERLRHVLCLPGYVIGIWWRTSNTSLNIWNSGWTHSTTRGLRYRETKILIILVQLDFKLLDFVVSDLFRIWASICLRPKSLDVQSFFEMEQQRFLADCCFHHHALGKRPSRAAALAVGVVLFSRTLLFHPIPCRLQQHALLIRATEEEKGAALYIL